MNLATCFAWFGRTSLVWENVPGLGERPLVQEMPTNYNQ
jgi:hypothetical protein